jgi:hypothetical protein
VRNGLELRKPFTHKLGNLSIHLLRSWSSLQEHLDQEFHVGVIVKVNPLLRWISEMMEDIFRKPRFIQFSITQLVNVFLSELEVLYSYRSGMDRFIIWRRYRLLLFSKLRWRELG